ncbi:MAG: hypothetical protein J6A54_01055 [Clostridia bacterium]|nr:hypothetical protein [Clostridia bacterium]
MKSKKAKKTTIITISLACVLVALIFVWIFAINPLLNKEEEEKPPFATPVGGESTYFGNLSLYPQIEVKDLISITVTNKNGTLNFISKLDEETVTRQIRLAEYPNLRLDESVLVNLRVPTLIAMCTSNQPLRDVTEQDKITYGTTPEECTVSFTVKYYDGAEQKEHTVYVGNKSLNSVSSYFVSVEGRDVIYELSSILEDGLMLEKTDYVSPLINSVYSEAEAVYNVKRIMIGNSKSELPFIGVQASKQELDDSISIKHTIQFPISANNVSADTTYLSSVLRALVINMSGDKVMAIDPDNETKKKYGVSAEDELKTIYIETFDDASLELGIIISQLKEDENGEKHYYLLTDVLSEGTSLIIRLSAETYSFLEEKNAIKWVATNSIDAGFTKYIYANDQEGESGVESIKITSNTLALKGFSDKFILTTSPDPTNPTKVFLTVTTESGLYKFEDDLNAEVGSDRNQFNNFYSVLVNYPMPNCFNTMSEEQREAIKTSENLLFSIRVKMKDGSELGYDYYKIDSAGAMCEFFDDKNPEPRVVFDTTTEHINILATALKQLINGEKVERK